MANANLRPSSSCDPPRTASSKKKMFLERRKLVAQERCSQGNCELNANAFSRPFRSQTETEKETADAKCPRSQLREGETRWRKREMRRKETLSTRSLNSQYFFRDTPFSSGSTCCALRARHRPLKFLFVPARGNLCSRGRARRPRKKKRETKQGGGEERNNKRKERRARFSRNGSQRATEVRNDACSPTGGTDVHAHAFTRTFHAKWKENEESRKRERERERGKLSLDYRSKEFARVRLGNRVSRASRAPLGWRGKEE